MTTRRTAKSTPPKKTRARSSVPMAEGDRVNATIEASRAAGETHLVEVTTEELARLNATATVEKPALLPARRR